MATACPRCHSEDTDIFKNGNPCTAIYLAILLCGMILLSSSLLSFAAERKNTMKIPEGYAGMMAYGSLISLSSMEQTLGHKYEGLIHKVHLTGYERAWACVRPFNDPLALAAGREKTEAFFLRGAERIPFSGTAEMNIYPKKRGQINGILYLITNEELIGFDKRERGYRRVDVTDRIEEFRFRGGKVYVYEGLPGSPVASSAVKGTYILIKEFFDLVTGACDAIGKDFRNEFDKSTRPCIYPVVALKNIIWGKAK